MTSIYYIIRLDELGRRNIIKIFTSFREAINFYRLYNEDCADDIIIAKEIIGYGEKI